MLRQCIVILLSLGLAAAIILPIYWLSGLFGPRLPEGLNPNASEPAEEEFSTTE